MEFSLGSLFGFAILLPLIMLLPFFSFSLVRRKLEKKVSLMMTEKSATSDVNIDLLQKKVAVATPLQIVIVTADTLISSTDSILEPIVVLAKKEYQKYFWSIQAFLTLNILLGLLPQMRINIIYTPLFLFIANLLRFLAEMQTFSAYTSGYRKLVKPLWKFISYLFAINWYSLVYIYILWEKLEYLMLFAFVPAFNKDNGIKFSKLYAILLGIIILLQVYLYYWHRLQDKKRYNLSLLILRVFGNKKIASFTFKQLVSFWKRFGSYFTIVDPVYYSIRWKEKYYSRLPIYGGILFLVYLFTLIVSLIFWTLTPIIFFIGIIVCSPLIVIFYNRYFFKKTFINNTTVLQKRIQQHLKWPVGNQNKFKELPLMCYDNTWKPAVHSLSQIADVILMDLRGYTAINKGCAYEVGFLFDNIITDKIIFLVENSALYNVENLLTESWSELKEASPNFNNKDPKAFIYTTTKEDDKDTQGIIDLLLAGAIKSNPFHSFT